MVFSAGSRLGAYEVRCLLGTGGMGEVYEARDPRLDRFVALKVLRSEVASDPDRLNRFEREARAVAALNHPNIVTLHDIEETDGTRFLVMERIEGRPLSELIEPGGLPLKQILDWAIPIADALAAAHAHGVVHRDLKPGNVMVSEEGRPKILDFGLARISATPSSSVHTGSVTEALTAGGNVFGTVPYMAPEQLRGERADAPTDLFAFGVMLYEMAAGRRPFIGATQAEVAASILKEDPPPLEGIRTDLPATFIKIVRHCLEKDPRQRIQSAADLRHELSDLAEELRTRPAALALAVLPPTRPAAKKHWIWLAVVVSLLLVSAALVLILHPFSPKLAGAMPIQSLAVLPLKNYSGDASQDFFADGMTDALIADLAQIRALKVISRTSAMLYKDTKKPIAEIAKELGVEGIVEGSVVRSGSRVRVTVQLIDARQDRNLWGSNYEREMMDVLALQGEVAGAIASEIRVQVTPEESERLKTARTVDADVYGTTLRGKATLEYATREEQARQAIDLFRKAVDRDPTYAPAWAGLGEALWFLAGIGGEFVAPAEVRDKAIEAADRALKLDPNLADAHKARAVIAIDGEWDLEKAQRHFERALELRPGYAAAHNLYGQMLLSPLSRFDEARRHLDRARELDPLSPWNDVNLIAWWLYQGKIERALVDGERAIQRNPTLWILPWQMGFARLLLGQPDQAVPEFEAALKLLHSDRPADALAPLGLAYGLAGHRTGALKILAEMEEASQKRYISPFDFAVVYSGLGRMDEAFRLLDRALEQRTPWLFLCTPYDPFSVALRRDPRWKPFVDRLRKSVRLPPGTPSPYLSWEGARPFAPANSATESF